MNAVLICNPRAGRQAAGGALDPALDVLRTAGWNVVLQQSTGPGDTVRLARDAVDAGLEFVLVAGGDGTLNEAVQSLAGTSTALGYLPCGTVNVWARELRLPMDAAGAARAIVDGRVLPIDLGTANQRYFLLMAGLGFDGEVVRRARVVERYKTRFGTLPYVVVAVSTATRYRGADLELRYDGLIRRVQALMLVVSNTRLYGGRFHLTPQAVANDGWLDVCIIKGRGPVAMARQSIPVLLSGSIAYSDVELFRVRDLAVQANQTHHFQLDGELAGTTPIRFGIAPRALQVIVPPAFDSDLIP